VNEDTPTPVAKTAPSVANDFDDEDETVVATAPVVAKPAASDKAQDILAMIRARQKA
jgi:hypothetical protein